MREDISIKKVKDVCEVIPGQSPKSKFYNFEGEGLPFYQGKKRFTDKFLNSPVKWTTNITKEAVEGDILMSVRAPVGPVNFATQKICIGRGLAAIRPKEKVDRDYLFYFFLKNEADLESTSGAVFDSINSKQIRNIKIPILPLPEQKRIVAILDEAFEAIDHAKANVEKNIQNAEELFQSKLNEIFSQRGEDWEEKSLGSLGTITSSKRIYKKEYVEKGVPFYRSKEIKELGNENEITTELFISKKRYLEIKKKFGVPSIGDVLLTAVGTIGEMYVVSTNEEFYFKDGNIMWLKDFEALNPYYLKFALLNFVEQLQSISQGSAYKALTIEKTKKYSIPVPPIEKQKSIVKQLENYKDLSQSIFASNKIKLLALEELKKSILQKAFSGELTAKEQVAV